MWSEYADDTEINRTLERRFGEFWRRHDNQLAALRWQVEHLQRTVQVLEKSLGPPPPPPVFVHTAVATISEEATPPVFQRTC
jgi:hypothetical protein